jgi:hypothetical protein
MKEFFFRRTVRTILNALSSLQNGRPLNGGHAILMGDESQNVNFVYISLRVSELSPFLAARVKFPPLKCPAVLVIIRTVQRSCDCQQTDPRITTESFNITINYSPLQNDRTVRTILTYRWTLNVLLYLRPKYPNLVGAVVHCKHTLAQAGLVEKRSASENKLCSMTSKECKTHPPTFDRTNINFPGAPVQVLLRR